MQDVTDPSTDPQAPVGVTFGSVVNVPNNFLGAGIQGKGWTVTGETVVNGQRAVILGRRVGETGAIETHQIDADTYRAAKAYKDEQGGMSKNKRPPVLKENELGKALDPQGDLVPDFFDAATRSYRLRLPGGRTPEWVPESLILNLRQGKPQALAELRRRVKLDTDIAGTNAPTTGAQLAQGVVASAILGKSLATRLGLRQEKQEASPERPSTDTTPASQKRKEPAPEDRVAKEAEERRENLEGKEDNEEKEEDEKKTARAVYRTNTYTATNKPNESAQVRADTPGAESTLRVVTNRATPGAVRAGTPLSLSPLPTAPEVAEASPSTQAANEPREAVRREAPKSRDRKTRGEEAKQAALAGRTTKTPQKTDVVQATLERSAARKAKQERQQAKKVEHIERAYSALEVNPEFKQLAYQIGLEHLQTDPSDYFRQKIQGKAITLDRNGWILDRATGQNLGHVLSIDLQHRNGLRTDQQIKQKALRAWHVRQAQQQGQAPHVSRAPRAITASQVVRKQAPKARKERALSLTQLGNITRTPEQQKDIRRWREFMSTQQKARFSAPSTDRRDSSGALLGTLAGVGAFVGLGAVAARAGQPSGLGPAARLTAALPGLSREEALGQVSQAREAQEARVYGLRLWLSAPDTPSAEEASASSTRTETTEETTGETKEANPEEPSESPSQPKQPLSLSVTLAPGANQGTDLDPASVELAAELLAAEKELAHLQAVENALQTLPEGAPVPDTLPSVLEDMPIPEQPQTLDSETAPMQEDIEEPIASPSIVPVPPPAPPSPEPATTPSSSTPKTRVGVPPVQRAAGRRPQSRLSRWKNRVTLPLAFASMANLGAAQSFDQGARHRDDPREMALSSDTSVPSETNDTSPIRSAQEQHRPVETQEDREDVPKTTLEEAQTMRETGREAQANQEQFSGKQPASGPVEGSASAPGAPEEASAPPEEGPLSPSQQMNAAARMNAAQQQDKQAQPSSSPSTKTDTTVKTTANAPESSPTGRLTVVKLIWDVIEGSLDVLGFGEFLVDANTALINDKYFHLAVGPSLKVPGASERTQRYINYSVILLDGLIAALLFVNLCIIVIAIVAVTCAASVTCVIRAVT